MSIPIKDRGIKGGVVIKCALDTYMKLNTIPRYLGVHTINDNIMMLFYMNDFSVRY